MPKRIGFSKDFPREREREKKEKKIEIVERCKRKGKVGRDWVK
jgi:hypothetical protein